MKKIIILALFSFVLNSCNGQQKNSTNSNQTIETVDSKTYSDKLKSSNYHQLIDVRTPQEYASEHIENAININWNGSDFTSTAEKLDKTKPVFVYCKVGGRSSMAAEKLAAMGFTKVYNLDGGIMKWTGNKTDANSGKQVGMSVQDYNKLINTPGKVIVNFNAEWCAPCKKMAPYMIKMQEELKGKIVLERIDADKNKSIVESLKIDGLPVIIIYENGKEIWKHVGYLSEDDLRKHL